jgi:hypothetical protein
MVSDMAAMLGRAALPLPCASAPAPIALGGGSSCEDRLAH